MATADIEFTGLRILTVFNKPHQYAVLRAIGDGSEQLLPARGIEEAISCITDRIQRRTELPNSPVALRIAEEGPYRQALKALLKAAPQATA